MSSDASVSRSCLTCKFENEPASHPACASCRFDFTNWEAPETAPADRPSLPEGAADRPSLPEGAADRNALPMADGLLDYFPNALAEVSRLSHVATLQHHPDAGMHWDRSKSTDHRNKIVRHLVDTGKVDDKGMRHSAMVAWRALALLQEEMERDLGLPPSRASRNRPF